MSPGTGLAAGAICPGAPWGCKELPRGHPAAGHHRRGPLALRAGPGGAPDPWGRQRGCSPSVTPDVPPGCGCVLAGHRAVAEPLCGSCSPGTTPGSWGVQAPNPTCSLLQCPATLDIPSHCSLLPCPVPRTAPVAAPLGSGSVLATAKAGRAWEGVPGWGHRGHCLPGVGAAVAVGVLSLMGTSHPPSLPVCGTPCWHGRCWVGGSPPEWASCPAPAPQQGVTAVTRKSAAVSPLPRNTPTQGAQGQLGHAAALSPSLPSLWHPVGTGCWVAPTPGCRCHGNGGVQLQHLLAPGLAQAGPCPRVPRPLAAWHTDTVSAGPSQPGPSQAAAPAPPVPSAGWHMRGRLRRGGTQAPWGTAAVGRVAGPPPLVPPRRAGAGHRRCWGGRGARTVRGGPGARGCPWGSYPRPSTPAPSQCHGVMGTKRGLGVSCAVAGVPIHAGPAGRPSSAVPCVGTAGLAQPGWHS